MAGPLIISFWMRAIVTFVDTIYASRIGDSAVAAIGLTIPFEFLMIALWVGLSTGLTSGLSRAMGGRFGAQVEQYLRVSWRLVWIASPVFTVIGAGIWLLAGRVGLDPEVAASFRVYGAVLIGGSAFTSFWSIIPDSLVKAHQDTRSTMWAGICTNIINVILNTVFLFVLEWGVFGIALSTVLGRIGGLWYAIVRARWHERRRLAAGRDDRPELDPRPYRSILGLAIPSSLTFALMAVETALVNGLLAHMAHATEAIASYSIYYRVVLFALQPVIATGVAMLPYAARRFGEGDVAGVHRGIRQTVVASAAYALVVVGPIMLIGAPWIATHLAESPLTAAFTTFALRAVPLACLTGALFLLCRPVFEAMGRGGPGLVMAVIRYGVLTAPLAWFGMHTAAGLGEPPLYGLIVGLLGAAAIASLIFAVWLWRALPPTGREDADRTGGSGTGSRRSEADARVAVDGAQAPAASDPSDDTVSPATPAGV
ncbi:MAG: MATE family efflux transporter [Candidatus Eiseniibacteriota bacterium]|jgi:Na+-driven multidrug efflux pump